MMMVMLVCGQILPVSMCSNLVTVKLTCEISMIRYSMLEMDGGQRNSFMENSKLAVFMLILTSSHFLLLIPSSSQVGSKFYKI